LRFARAFDEDRLAVARDAAEQIAQVNSRFCGGDAPHRPTSYQSIDRSLDRMLDAGAEFNGEPAGSWGCRGPSRAASVDDAAPSADAPDEAAVGSWESFR
jgi:hypothetical protein